MFVRWLILLEMPRGGGRNKMPYKSKKQRAWMHINKPKIAKRWDKKYGGKIAKKSKKK